MSAAGHRHLSAGAAGVRRAWTDRPAVASSAILVGIYGAGLIAAGTFVADPSQGYPPAAARTVILHGVLHLLSAAGGFLALFAACVAVGGRFGAAHEPTRALFSHVAGSLFLASFMGLAADAGSRPAVAGFWVGPVLAWTWLRTLMSWLSARAAEQPSAASAVE